MNIGFKNFKSVYEVKLKSDYDNAKKDKEIELAEIQEISA